MGWIKHFFLFLSCYFLHYLSFAQVFLRDSIVNKKTYYHNIIKTNPAAILWSQVPLTGEIRFIYERVLSDREASVLGFSFIVPSPLITDTIRRIEKQYNINLKMYGFRLQVAQKFYLPAITGYHAPQGFYLAPHASYYMAYLYVKGYRRSNYLQAVFTNFSLLFGYQRLWRKRYPIDICAGLGYRYNFFMVADSQNPIPINMGAEESGIPGWLKISLSTNFGIAF